MSYTGSVPGTQRPIDWRTGTPCKADPDVMYGTSDASVERAKSICRGCPVMEQCAQWALENRELYGTWGGLSERERIKILRRRGARIPVHDEPPKPERTLHTLWAERSAPAPAGHHAWTGGVPVWFKGRYYTAPQIAFEVDRGRPPVGNLRRLCDVGDCVQPSHLADQEERLARLQARAGQPPVAGPPVVRNGRTLAPCGTRSAYQRHVRNREPVDDACRAANNAANNQLLRTGTTKALAS